MQSCTHVDTCLQLHCFQGGHSADGTLNLSQLQLYSAGNLRKSGNFKVVREKLEKLGNVGDNVFCLYCACCHV